MSTTSFGPSALATPANAITMARVLFTPVLLVWIVASGDSWPAVTLWIALSATDGVDGYLARRHGTTRSGAFLDPLADKFLVLGALAALAAKDRFGWLPVLIIAAREVAMSVYRAWMSRRGVSIPARFLAKVKTVSQDIAVGLALFPPTANNDELLTVAIWIAVALTVISGAQYLLDGSKAAADTPRVNAEVVAVGTELLLGQIVDTNSSWIGERLALAGIDSHFQTKVGDNLARIVSALRIALDRSDAVVVCGGLGPTQDDITREAIAEVMGVALERDEAIVERIEAMFEARGRTMAANNARQADVPAGATVIDQTRGTAPGLICPVGDKVLYAVPGVPYEMQDMVERAIVPDLQSRMGERAAIVSRVLRTWGEAESSLAEQVGPRLEALQEAGNPTIAFLASGIEGIKVRITAKAPTESEALGLIEAEEAELRAILGTRVFGIDDETMEKAVGALLEDRGWTLGLAESMTGGLVAHRVTDIPGSSKWFKGSVVAYASQVKFDVLDVPEGPVVTEEAAAAMAAGACRVLGADVGLSVTGVAGPAEQEGKPPGTVFVGLCIQGEVETLQLRLPGDRDRVRQFATISMLDLLRRRLLEL